MDLPLLVERGEAQANEDMFRAAPRDLAGMLGIEAFRISDATALIVRKADDTQFNQNHDPLVVEDVVPGEESSEARPEQRGRREDLGYPGEGVRARRTAREP